MSDNKIMISPRKHFNYPRKVHSTLQATKSYGQLTRIIDDDRKDGKWTDYGKILIRLYFYVIANEIPNELLETMSLRRN